MGVRLLLVTVLTGLLLTIWNVSAQSDDSIPDNCNYPYAPFYRASIFPRYEPQNRRLLLMDWTTGADVAVLGTDLDDTLIQGWSGNCRYLAVATGSSESRATVVYDTVGVYSVGSVPGAHLIPHPITWGPDEFLMVEGRNGAVLWNVPLNIQYPINVGFNEVSSRNFSRLRWDAENQQVIANLAVGGRAVYDLRTGEQTVTIMSGAGELVIGGERFKCLPNHNPHGGANVDGLWLTYAPDGGVAYLQRGYGRTDESMATIEAGIPSSYLQSLGWSINCRYIAGAFGSSRADDIYETVIWDFLEGRRVGSFPDARDLPHYLTWDTAEKQVLIETRNGAYVWNLLTDERLLVNETVKAPPFNCRYDECQSRSFERVYWDAGRDQLLGVPVQTSNAVVAYDVNSGAEIVRYTIEGASEPLDFITSNDSRLLLAYADGRVTLWNRESGATSGFVLDGIGRYVEFSRSSAISTDNRFFAFHNGRTLRVWDLTTLAANAAPTFEYEISGYGFWGSNMFFLNSDTLDSGNPYTSVRVNVVTGELFGSTGTGIIDPQAQTVQTYGAVSGTSGQGIVASATVPGCPLAARYERDERQLIVRDTRTDTEQIIESDLNRMFSLHLSPDCKTVYGDVQLLNTSLSYDEAPAQEPYGYRRYGEQVFWDVATGERIATLNDPPLGKHQGASIRWNPDGDRALVGTGDGYYILHPGSRLVARVQFQDSDQGYLPSRMDTYWDHGRGVVLVAGFGEVFAIDMQTGGERLRFPALESSRGGCYFNPSTGCGFEMSKDSTWVFIFGNSSLSIWNMDTLANASVPVASPSGGTGGTLISPDGRYVVVSRSAVRVWDLQNLAADFEDRTPIATYGIGNEAVISVTFSDNQTLEVVTRVTDGTTTSSYDLLTGAVK